MAEKTKKGLQTKSTSEAKNLFNGALTDGEFVLKEIDRVAKKYDDALGFLKQADANDPFVQMLLAQANEGAGHKDDAQAAWTNVLKSGAHNVQNAIARPAARKALGK